MWRKIEIQAIYFYGEGDKKKPQGREITQCVYKLRERARERLTRWVEKEKNTV